eukprot:2367003-Pleurochrysis_carterae.AAC.1
MADPWPFIVGPITGVFLLFMLRDNIMFTKRPKSVPQRDAVAPNESAADRHADALIDRSSCASDACTIRVKYKVSHIDVKLRIRPF